MVNSLSDVDILFNKSSPLHTNYKVTCSKHKRKYSDRTNECDRFRSRKPPKNPREVVIHKQRQKKICAPNLNELQESNLKFQKLIGSRKTNQVASIEPTERQLQKSVPKLLTRQRFLNCDRTPKLQSKSKFALNRRQSGSNFSLVVNLSRGKLRYPYRLKHQSLKDEFSQKFLTADKLKQNYLIVPVITTNELNYKYQILPFIMENLESDSSGQSVHTKKTPKEICLCSPAPNKKKATPSLNDSREDEQEIDKESEHWECFGDGYPDMYRQMLGPTPDESILAGLQTVIDMCSTSEVKSTKQLIGETYSNLDIIKWVENEYSTLNQDSQTNPCHASLYNIQQRKETLHEIEKLVKKKSELDREALIIKKEKTVSLSSKTSGSCRKGTSTREETEEDEEEEQEETSLSKLACSCGTVETEICEGDPSKVDKKCQCTQTMPLQKCKCTQHPSSTSIESTSSDKAGDSSDDEDLSDKSTQTTETSESTSGDCTNSNKTSETHTSTKCSECSTTVEESCDDTESIQCSCKSVQACKPIPLSTKSVQTCTQTKQLTIDHTKHLPTSFAITHPIKPTCACLAEQNEVPTKLLTPKKSLSPNRSEQAIELVDQSVQSTPLNNKILNTSLEDVTCTCKRPQLLNHSIKQNSEQTPSTSPKSTQTSTEKSKSTSNRSIQTSEGTSKSSRIPFCVREDSSWKNQHSERTKSNLCTKELPGTVPTLKTEKSPEKNTREGELSVSNKKLSCHELNDKSTSPPCLCQNTLLLQQSTERLSKASGNEKVNNMNTEKEVPDGIDNVQKMSSSKLLKTPRRSGTLEPVPEESSSKSTLCKICSPKSSSARLLAECASEASYNNAKISQFPCGHIAQRKQRPLRSERSKDKLIEKTSSVENELSKKVQTLGDCFAETASPEVRYAMVRITKFEQYSTFEILDTSLRKPKCFPATIETVFVVKNKTK